MKPADKVKLKRFKRFTIRHASYNGALDTLHRAIESGKITGENCGAVLLGESGTGKSRICDQLTNEFPHPKWAKSEDIQKLVPVVKCVVPNDATVKSLMARILRGFEAYHNYQNQEEMEYCLFQTLINCKTKLLILDEWPHLYRSGTSRAIKNAADFAKVLTDLFKRPVFLVGETDAEAAIDSRSALADRFPYRALLKPFSLETPESYNEFSKVLRCFAIHIKTEMNFVEVPPLTDEKMVLAVYISTGGNFRGLSTLLTAALTNALDRSDGHFLKEDLIIGFKHIKVSARLTNKNPFDMTSSELQRVIANSRNKRNRI